MKQFTCNGVWWLPESLSTQVAGSLQFSKEAGLQLSLFGVLGESSAMVGKKRLPIILGAVWDSPLGEEVTLTGSWAKTKSMSFGSVALTREEYHVDRAFIGSHLENDQSFSFTHLKISFSGLSSWAHNYSGFDQRYISKTPDHRAIFEIRWISPEPISGRIPGGELHLGLGAKMSMHARDWSIKEHIGLSITVEQPQSADTLNAKFIYPLQNFLTLATDHSNALVEFCVRRPDGEDDIHVIGARTFDDEETAEGLTPHKMIFSLNDVRDRAIQLFSRWIEVSERLSRVCNVYFASLYKPDTFVDTRFLAVFQALEVYERTLPDSVGNADPQGSRLREQFTGLLETHKQVVGPLYGKDVASAVAELLTYRNDVVHRNTDLAKQQDYSEQLFWWLHRLQFLMKACLLTELEMPEEEQVRFLSQNQMFVHIAGLRNG
jgi:ApeA N-terminal domain 1